MLGGAEGARGWGRPLDTSRDRHGDPIHVRYISVTASLRQSRRQSIFGRMRCSPTSAIAPPDRLLPRRFALSTVMPQACIAVSFAFTPATTLAFTPIGLRTPAKIEIYGREVSELVVGGTIAYGDRPADTIGISGTEHERFTPPNPSVRTSLPPF